MSRYQLTEHERVLAESRNFLVVHEFEYARVIDKRTGVRLALGYHRGDPICAAIARNESWFAAGGLGVTILHEGRLREVGTPMEWYVEAMREDPPGCLRVLLDPWSDSPGVFEIDPTTGSSRQLSDQPDLRGQPRTATVPY